MIKKKYVVRNIEFYVLKDIIQPYYNNHKKKFENFSVCVMWMKNGLIVKKISVPSTIPLQKPNLFKPSLIGLPIEVRVPSFGFLDTFDSDCINEEIDEKNIAFTSDLKDMSLSHYMAQPKSMLCRKLVRNFIEKEFGGFDYTLLRNCFRHINKI